MATEIVSPAFQQGDTGAAPQGLAHLGQIPMEELFLEILGAGGEEQFATGQQGGDEIGEGFAGARARLADQNAAIGQGLGHRLGHGQLLGPKAIAWDIPGQRPLGTEDRGKLAHRRRGYGPRRGTSAPTPGPGG